MKKLLYFTIIIGLIPNLINIVSGITHIPLDSLFTMLSLIVLALLIPINLVIFLFKVRKHKLMALLPLLFAILCTSLIYSTSLLGQWFRFKIFIMNELKYEEIYSALKINEIKSDSITGHVDLPDKYRWLQGNMYCQEENGKIDVRVIVGGGFPCLFSRFRFKEMNGGPKLVLDHDKWYQERSD